MKSLSLKKLLNEILSEKQIENPSVRKRMEDIEIESDQIRAKLTAKIHAYQKIGSPLGNPGNQIYKEDEEYRNLYDKLVALGEEKKNLRPQLYKERQIVGTYIRFGEMPKTRSVNHLRQKSDTKRFEHGISVYPAIFNKKEDAWQINDSDIYAEHVGATDSCISQFTDGKIKAYLIRGTEFWRKYGSDGEPLLDPRTMKIVKVLDKVFWDYEVWEYNANNAPVEPKSQPVKSSKEEIFNTLVRGGMSPKKAKVALKNYK